MLTVSERAKNGFKLDIINQDGLAKLVVIGSALESVDEQTVAKKKEPSQ